MTAEPFVRSAGRFKSWHQGYHDLPSAEFGDNILLPIKLKTGLQSLIETNTLT